MTYIYMYICMYFSLPIFVHSFLSFVTFHDISILFISYIPYHHLNNDSLFFLFQGLRKLREAAEMKTICGPPVARGTPRARAGHGRYSCELASECGVSLGPQSQQVISYFPQCFLPHCRGPMGSLPIRLCPKGSPLCPHYLYSRSTEGEGTLAGGAPSHGPF